MSTINVTNLKHGSASTNAITFASDGTCDVKASNISGHKNLIINGAMNVAQRGTSSSAEGYTCDRWQWLRNGHDEEATHAQVAVGSSDTGPYELGFRNAFQVTNGNQSSGADAADYALIRYTFEAQDIANSGWNHDSATSYITLSFWVKSSVAQNFYGTLRTIDGTDQGYPFETGSLTADTWTKITKTIPGLANGNLDFNDDNGSGLRINIWPFAGTNFTTSGVTLDAWAAHDNATRFADNTTTWWTTDNSTFAITGVQLEVGDTATTFEHRSYGDELLRCQRYYQTAPADTLMVYNDNTASWLFPVAMRAAPSMAFISLSGSGAALAATANGFRQSASNSQTSGIGYTAAAEL